MEPGAKLKVVSGRRGTIRECHVMIDGQEEGCVGEELSIPSGVVTVEVRYPPYTCNSLTVEVPAGGRAVLDYNTGPLAYLGLVALFPAFVAVLGVVVWVMDRAPNAVGVFGGLGLLALTYLLAEAAVGVPLRVLGWCGVRTHRLRLVRVTPDPDVAGTELSPADPHARL